MPAEAETAPVRAAQAGRTTQRYESSLARLLNWAQSQNYAGYSKFDVFNSPLLQRLSLGNRLIRLGMTAAWSRSPVNLRPLVRTAKSRNPKGIALFAIAYLRRYVQRRDAGDLRAAEQLLNWLDDCSAPGYSGKCWGYDHDWQSLHFFAPKFSPNIVVTGNVAYAFLEAYAVTGRKAYLDVARSTVDFMLRDLETPFENAEMRNIGYVPGSRWQVLNISGLAGTILIRVWQHTGEPLLRSEATRLLRFLVSAQTDYGAWHYAWPPASSNVKHDNYHTGNVLDWVLEYSYRSGDGQFLPNFARGLAFYRKNLFLPDGAPKWASHRTYPFDVHGAAQGIVTFATAALNFDKSYLPDARRAADWAIANLQHPQGYYYYQKSRFWTKKYTLMRWCNAWMANALSTLLLAEYALATAGSESCAG